MSTCRCQCQLLLMTSMSASEEEPLEDDADDVVSSGSRSISLRKIRSGSSSRRVEISTFSEIQSGLPRGGPRWWGLRPAAGRVECGGSSRLIFSRISSSRRLLTLAPAVRCTSALTPTRASLPSARDTWADPLHVGRRSVSARRGRNSVGDRKSGRRGGVCVREVWR